MSNKDNLPKKAPGRDLSHRRDRDEVRYEFNPIPATRVRGLTFWLVLVGFGFLGAIGLYATKAEIQSAVLAPGSFEVEGDLQVVDHLEGGILSKILVEEGDQVEAGQVLVALDGTRAKSQLGIVKSQLATALARQARLEAEASGADAISFSPELENLVRWDPTLAKAKANQLALFQASREADLGEMQIYEERIQQLNIRLEGFGDEISALQEQHQIVQEEVEDLVGLYRSELIPKARLFARREDLLEVKLRISQSENERHNVFEQVAEVEERRLQVLREKQELVSNEQQTLTENIFNLRQRVRTFEEVMGRLEIRAPIAGRVVGFETNTIGSVVAAGQILMEIVPRNAPFIIEARVATSDIDEVGVGQAARIRLSAYSYRKTPPIDGEVSYVSADSFFDQTNNISYYDIHVKVASKTLDDLPNVRPQPGMPVQVMVATGEQTVLNYLLDPVLGGLETALIESE